MTTPTPDRRPPVDLSQIDHETRCPGGGITRRDGIEHALIACSGCGRSAAVPLRRDWSDGAQPTGEALS